MDFRIRRCALPMLALLALACPLAAQPPAYRQAHKPNLDIHIYRRASAPDENAHNLFAVRGAPRARLAPIPLRGVSWGEGVWHRVRLEREGTALRVWFDGELVLEARDPDPREGRIGVGSFDDTGRFRALRVYAPRTAEPPPGEPFAG